MLHSEREFEQLTHFQKTERLYNHTTLENRLIYHVEHAILNKQQMTFTKDFKAWLRDAYTQDFAVCLGGEYTRCIPDPSD